jgi:hypothetical protein
MKSASAANPIQRSRQRSRRLRRVAVAIVPLAAVCAYLLLSGYWGSRTAHAAIVGSGAGHGLISRTVPQDSGTTVTPSKPQGFRIAGSVGGLYPGKTALLVLTVTNFEPFAIVVQSLSVSVGNANTGCTASSVSVTGFTGALAVPKLGTAMATVQFTLLHSAPDACQGAVFALTYSGEATKQ